MIKRNMSLIVSNQFFTVLADSIFNLAILWYVYQMTQSSFFAATVTVITSITNIFVGPFIGVIIDRMKPKTSMQVGYFIMIFIGIILGLSYLFKIDFLLGLIFVSLFIQDICMLFISPAKNKLLPRIVGEERIVKVNGYISSVSQTGELIGQTISGFVIGIIGFIGVMLTHSIVYLIASILLIFLVNIKDTNTKHASQEINGDVDSKTLAEIRNIINDLKIGFYILRKNKSVFKLVLLATALNVSTIAGSLLVVLVADHYNANAVMFGIMNAGGATIGILIGLGVSKIVYLAKPNIIIGFSLLVCGLSFLGMGITQNFYIGTIFFLAMTGSSILINIIFSSSIILLIEDQYRGRVFTITVAIASILMPFLALGGGYIADILQVSYLFLFAGVWLIIWSFAPFIDKDLRNISQLQPKN